jgi:hypothetical protein
LNWNRTIWIIFDIFVSSMGESCGNLPRLNL